MKTIRLPRVKTAVVTAGLAATLLGGAVVNAPTASAATPTCSKFKRVENGNLLYAWVPASSAGSTACQLTTGNSSTAVSTLQATLNKCYGSEQGNAAWNLGIDITVDGEFGSQTKSALKKVQQVLKDSNYYDGAVDGIYGPMTSKAMHHRQYYQDSNRYSRCFRVLGQ
ncbi:peptidoglycan-binding protein [Streptomyces sp. NBC_00882]|uniref:peptidoglycan-binding domain-containing protein n=1 Tax=Streptomyces TaxID=1883 RepID=UPI0038642A75|nr:peptidoglycan-binding protein [Streptomyces sp. NBC_00882]WSZ61036.1 peptidoglycan-binding protein [Streptomyces canus]